MFENEIQRKIKDTIEEFFKKMTFEIEIISFSLESGIASIGLKSKEPKILIGEKGETLLEIQHLLKTILRKKIITLPKCFYLEIDINDYKKKKITYLKEMAKTLAEEVILTKKEKILPPMLPYERRIIHLELANHPNVTSESIGEEPERRVVIRPYP